MSLPPSSLHTSDLKILAPDALNAWYNALARMYQNRMDEASRESNKRKVGSIYNKFVQAGALVGIWSERRAREFLEKNGTALIAGHIEKRLDQMMSPIHPGQADQVVALNYLVNSLQSVFNPKTDKLALWRKEFLNENDIPDHDKNAHTLETELGDFPRSSPQKSYDKKTVSPAQIFPAQLSDRFSSSKQQEKLKKSNNIELVEEFTDKMSETRKLNSSGATTQVALRIFGSYPNSSRLEKNNLTTDEEWFRV